MKRVWPPMMVAVLSMIGAGCSGDDTDSTTPLASAATSVPSTSSAADTSATTADPTTTPGSLPTTTPAPSTVPPPASTAVLHPVPDGTPPPQPLDEQGGASGLRSSVFCDPASPSSPAVTLTWVPAGSAGQLLAVSTLPDGFESGRYTVTDELVADITTHQISPIEPGGIYYWRVLTRSGGTWLSSVQESFTGPVCVLDSP